MASHDGKCPPTLRSFLASLFVGAQVLVVAQECAYDGGWALRNPRSCPPSAPVECGVGAQPRCCPSGFICTGDGDYVGNYCCSDPQDCRALALSHPKCPDSTWSLWGVAGQLDNGGWCCMSGFNGTYRDDSQGIALLCMPTTATALPQSYFWAETIATASCSVTRSSSTTAAATTATTTSSSSGSAAATGTSTATPTAVSGGDSIGNTTPGDEESSGGVSGGVVAGAIVGGVTGAALIAAGVFFFLYKRRKKSDATEVPYPTTAAEADGGGGGGGGGWAFNEQEAKFGPGGTTSELSGQGARSEMDGTAQPTFELDAAPHNAQELDSAAANRRQG